ncbi:MAG: TrmH family RNA methyltransferase [Spirochaetales bacterium]
MITLRKLGSLPPGTRDRKVLALLADLKRRLAGGEQPGSDELAYFCQAVALVLEAPVALPGTVLDLGDLRTVARLHQQLELQLGLSAADWDLQTPGDRAPGDDAGDSPPSRFPFAVWLEDLRSPFNVGSIARTAEALGFTTLYTSPACPPLDHSRVVRTAMGCLANLCTGVRSLVELKTEFAGQPVWALELGGTPLGRFSFPRSGLVLLGSEELGLSPEALAWAETSAGRVTLPLHGHKASLNVGVAFGIAGSAWATAVWASSPAATSL